MEKGRLEGRRKHTGCCGCRPTTRVSDNVVVAVADIFLFIFLSVVSASLSCGVGQPLQICQTQTAIPETERTDYRLIPAHRFTSPQTFSHLRNEPHDPESKLTKRQISKISDRGGVSYYKRLEYIFVRNVGSKRTQKRNVHFHQLLYRCSKNASKCEGKIHRSRFSDKQTSLSFGPARSGNNCNPEISDQSN